MAATAVYRAGLGLGGSGRERPGPRLPQAVRASARVRGAAEVRVSRATVRAGGNGGAAAASDNALGVDRYGAGMGVPAPPGDFLASGVKGTSVTA